MEATDSTGNVKVMETLKVGLTQSLSNTWSLSWERVVIKVCVHTHAPMHQHRGQSRMSSVLMNHSMPYSFERGSSTESGASLVAQKPQFLLSLFLRALGLQVPATMPAFPVGAEDWNVCTDPLSHLPKDQNREFWCSRTELRGCNLFLRYFWDCL